MVDEYVDDGWSGTNFDRPAFQRMMADVEDGKINCIVTKDLSRFGREHVMMDYYLEFVFPEKHIRYIALAKTDGTLWERGILFPSVLLVMFFLAPLLRGAFI